MQSNYFIVYNRRMLECISWPKDWHTCAANLAPMLREFLNIENIGSEIKCILHDGHLNTILKDHNVSRQDVDDYIKADCSTLYFSSPSDRNLVYSSLLVMGAELDQLTPVDAYRDVILKQAEVYRNRERSVSSRIA